MAAGFAQLNHLDSHPEIYAQLEQKTKQIVNGYKAVLEKQNLTYTMNQIGSMFSLFFTDQQVTDFASAKSCDTDKFGNYFRSMLEDGVYLAPSQFETLFVSTVIQENEVQKIVKGFENFAAG